jgi:hypothetical protein
MNIQSVEIEPFDGNWKSWFIIEEPEEKLKVSIFYLNGNGPLHVKVDPRFQKFKVSILSDKEVDPQIVVYYLFHEPKNGIMNICSTYGVSRFFSHDSKNRLIEFTMQREN